MKQYVDDTPEGRLFYRIAAESWFKVVQYENGAAAEME